MIVTTSVSLIDVRKLEKKLIKKVEKELYKEVKEGVAEFNIKELLKTVPVRSGKLRRGFRSYVVNNGVQITDKMIYWMFVEFGPHTKSSLGFTRRSIAKTERQFPNIIKKAFKKI